jgi:hypothetical protein
MFLEGSKETEIARPHIANQTFDWILHSSWEVTDHTPKSTNFSPSIFYFFVPIKKHLTGKLFASDTDMKQAVILQLWTPDTNFFYSSIQALVPQRNKPFKF